MIYRKINGRNIVTVKCVSLRLGGVWRGDYSDPWWTHGVWLIPHSRRHHTTNVFSCTEVLFWWSDITSICRILALKLQFCRCASLLATLNPSGNYSYSKTDVCWKLRDCESRLLNSRLYPHLGRSICKNAVYLEFHKATNHCNFHDTSANRVTGKLTPRWKTVYLLE